MIRFLFVLSVGLYLSACQSTGMGSVDQPLNTRSGSVSLGPELPTSSFSNPINDGKGYRSGR